MEPDAIIPELKASDRWSAIEELVNTLADIGRLDEGSRLGVARAVRLREATNSTAIGSGIALPHASCSFVDEVLVAFGRSKAGIDFAAPDKQPVRCVLLFVSPQGQFEAHLNTLALYSRLFQNEDLRRSVLAARDASEINKLLRQRAA